MNKNLVLIVGAGATVSDVVSRSKWKKPPLDKGFFFTSNQVNKKRSSPIINYFKNIYQRNITKTEFDSLEAVMAVIYSDLYEPNLESNAAKVFRDLIYLFNKRLAETTNNLKATKKRNLYRILCHYFLRGFEPNNINIITFNQDLEIEKILYEIQNVKRWSKKFDIFNFPYCYNIDITYERVTAPKIQESELFKARYKSSNTISVLKLHGSLNWYSKHNTPNLSPNAMFNPKRKINITRRKKLQPEMKLTLPRRAYYTFPLIVPPVTHKSVILNESIRPIWAKAEESLMKADEIMIFGYSCPPMDFESSNLIERAIKANNNYRFITVIDPDPNVLIRYQRLLEPRCLRFYPDAKYFLDLERLYNK
jgi:hypothetical protein